MDFELGTAALRFLKCPVHTPCFAKHSNGQMWSEDEMQEICFGVFLHLLPTNILPWSCTEFCVILTRYLSIEVNCEGEGIMLYSFLYGKLGTSDSLKSASQTLVHTGHLGTSVKRQILIHRSEGGISASLMIPSICSTHR